MQSIVRARPARGRHRRQAVRGHRHSKIFWLNAVALCLMTSGVVMAFAGRQVFRWAPPPARPVSAAAKGTQGSASAVAPAGLRPRHLVVRPVAGSGPVSFRIPDIAMYAR
jgi:hypothetical protein